MILTRSREFTVNMGNYESCKIGASVTVDTEKLSPEDYAQYKVSDAFNLAEVLLDEALASDLNEAKELTNTKDSFVLSWKAV